MPIALAQPGAIEAGVDLSKPAWGMFDGLIDTGSNTSCVAAAVAHRVGLKVSGITEMRSGNQTRDVDNYLADLVVPLDLTRDFLPTQCYANLRISEFSGEMETDILLGLDVLQNLAIQFDGPRRRVTVSAE